MTKYKFEFDDYVINRKDKRRGFIVGRWLINNTVKYKIKYTISESVSEWIDEDDLRITVY